MEKNLAIRGNAERGDEVISFLEMLGGENHHYTGRDSSRFYFIDRDTNYITNVHEDEMKKITNWYYHTLSSITKTYPYKVGDIVNEQRNSKITKMSWNPRTFEIEYKLNDSVLDNVRVDDIINDTYIRHEVEIDKPKFKKVDMIKESDKEVETTGYMQMGKTMAVIFNDANYEDEVELQLGDYEIEVRDGKTFAVKKKPLYPKTYKECCEIINACPTVGISYDSNEDMLYNDEVDLTLITLRKLLICRNAYWKIAGEQMGLDKSWKHDMVKDDFSYAISYQYGCIEKNEIRHKNAILAFPTKELRDTFYENFKVLIEECKELV